MYKQREREFCASGRPNQGETGSVLLASSAPEDEEGAERRSVIVARYIQGVQVQSAKTANMSKPNNNPIIERRHSVIARNLNFHLHTDWQRLRASATATRRLRCSFLHDYQSMINLFAVYGEPQESSLLRRPSPSVSPPDKTRAVIQRLTHRRCLGNAAVCRKAQT